MKLAIFDIDGTLTDSHGYDRWFFAALAARAGLEGYDGRLDGFQHVTDEGIAREFLGDRGLDSSPEAIAWIKTRYEADLEVHLREVPPIVGASAILDDLRARPDWRLAIATGNWGFAGERKLRAGGVDFAGIPVIGCDERPSREELMQHALDLSAAEHGPFERIVYLGDASWDAKATRALGWPLVGINRDPTRLEALGTTHILPHYEDLEAVHVALLEAGVPGT